MFKNLAKEVRHIRVKNLGRKGDTMQSWEREHSVLRFYDALPRAPVFASVEREDFFEIFQTTLNEGRGQKPKKRKRDAEDIALSRFNATPPFPPPRRRPQYHIR